MKTKDVYLLKTKVYNCTGKKIPADTLIYMPISVYDKKYANLKALIILTDEDDINL